MRYLQLALADIAQWSPLCWAAVTLCVLVIGVTVGAFATGGEAQ